MLNPYYLYMAEKEGYLNTRESKLQRVIKDIKNAAALVDGNFELILKQNGIEPDSLTERELRKIERALEQPPA